LGSVGLDKYNMAIARLIYDGNTESGQKKLKKEFPDIAKISVSIESDCWTRYRQNINSSITAKKAAAREVKQRIRASVSDRTPPDNKRNRT